MEKSLSNDAFLREVQRIVLSHLAEVRRLMHDENVFVRRTIGALRQDLLLETIEIARGGEASSPKADVAICSGSLDLISKIARSNTVPVRLVIADRLHRVATEIERLPVRQHES